MSLLHKLEWRRQKQPVLSALTTRQSWCRVCLYNPVVIRVNGIYRMWYIGNSTYTRSPDMAMGYAESRDGLNWTAHPDNPVLTGSDIPFGHSLQTPHVIFDQETDLYRMWFIATTGRLNENRQCVDAGCALGYADSEDGVHWRVHREPLLHDGRRPCVLKDSHNAYRMWMNSKPTADGTSKDLCRNIYRFTSPDGLQWQRDDQPVVSTEKQQLIVYPCVLQSESDYTMWYGRSRRETIGKNHGVPFELYCSTSADGINWTHHHDQATLCATESPDDFDGRYVSTPCVVDDGDRYLLYYGARDWGNLYGAGDGTVVADRAGIYRHIGVALCPKP